MENNNAQEKKVMALNKEMYKVEGGRVYIESEELANAIQNEGLDLFVDEEAGATSQGICFGGCF